MRSLEAKLARAWPPHQWRETKLLAAVSGGPDSVALVRALLAMQPQPGMLGVAHYNHGLRGADSEADQQFVAQFAGRWELPFFAGRADAAPLPAGEGLEAALRHARYAFLESTAAEIGARYVVTGHTADDQAETILHRIFRGTGLAGMAGMPRVRRLGPASLLRPLLCVRRSEVLAYLQELDQPFRVDATNADPRFTRNWLRHELLPRVVNAYGPQAIEAVLRLGEVAAEAQQLIRPAALALLRRAAHPANTKNANTVEVDCRPLAGEPPYVVREMFVALWEEQGWPLGQMNQARWAALANFAQADPISASGGTAEPARSTLDTLPGNIRVTKQGEKLSLFPPE